MIAPRRFITAFAVFSLILPSEAVPQTTTSGGAATVGSTIGTIVKSAIQTAFPAVGTLLTSILSASPKTANQPDSARVKVGDVKAAADTSTAKTSVQQQITAAIQPKLAPLSQVAAELAVVDQFLLPSTNASRALVSMQSDLAAASPDWNDVGLQWSLAHNQLQKLNSITDSQISVISDLWLRSQLSQIRDANDAPSLIIAAGIENKNKASTLAAIQKVAPVLDGMTAAAGYELANMQADIKSLANWAQGAAGSTTTENPFKQVVTQDLQLAAQ